jgi:hypothetical protein
MNMGERMLRVPALVGGLCMALCVAAAGQTTFDVRWNDPRLSVKAAAAPLAEVMDEIARQTGIRVEGRDKLTGRVSAEFDSLELDKALERLLTGVNYAIRKPLSLADGEPRLIVTVMSMAAGADPVRIEGPFAAPALHLIVAVEMEDDADEKEEALEEEEDREEKRKERLEADRLMSEGVFSAESDLTELLKHVQNGYNDEVRLEAVKALGLRPLATVRPWLLRALADEVWDVRSAAVEILSRAAGDKASLDAVGRLLATDDRDVRISALRVLAARGEPEAEPHLRAFVKMKLEDIQEHFREPAQQMLDEIEWRALQSKAGKK